MECPSCQKSYDSFSSGDINVIPRILSKCGHSFCHSCIVKLYDGKQVICPLCKSINISDSISNYTKNLALLQILVENQYCTSPMGRSNSALNEPFEITESQQSSGQSNKMQGFKLDLNSTLSNIHFQNKNGYQTCQDHQKPVEAFCWTEKQSLCIDCLLLQPQHKQHDIQNIEKSAVRQEENLRLTQEKVQQVKMQIQTHQDAILEQKSDLDEQESFEIGKFTNLFNELKEAIEMRSREAYLEIQNRIELKRREIIECEQKLKDFINDINAADFQILSVQLGPISCKIESLMTQMSRDQQANDLIDKIYYFIKGIDLKNESQNSSNNFDYKKEIGIIQKIVDDLHIKHIGPLPIPIIQKQITTTLRKSVSKVQSTANKEASAREQALLSSQKKNSTNKEAFSSRRGLVAPNLEKTHSTGLNSSQLNATQLSNLNNRVRTSQIKDEKQKPLNTSVRERRQSMTSRTASLQNLNQKPIDRQDIQLKQQRNMHKTPLKKIDEVSLTPNIKTQINFRRNASRAVIDKNSSQPTTTKANNAVNRTLQTANSVKDINFEQCLRQTLLSQQNQIIGNFNSSNSNATLLNNSRSYLNRLNQKSSTSNIYDDNYASNSSINKSEHNTNNHRKGSTNLPNNNVNSALNNSNISKMHIAELQNNSVAESEHEDNSSFASTILRLGADLQQNPQISVQPQINILIRDETQQSIQSSSSGGGQFIIGMGTLQTDQDQDYKEPHPQSAGLRNMSQSNQQRWKAVNQTQQIEEGSGDHNQYLSSRVKSSSRSQARYPSLRDQRNNIKESKRQSAIHQLEQESWLSRQAQIVESITQARQESSRKRDHSRQSNLQETSMIASLSSRIEELPSFQNRANQFIGDQPSIDNLKILDSAIKEDIYDHENLEDTQLSQLYTSNRSNNKTKHAPSSLLSARKQQAMNKKKQLEKEKNDSHIIGIISNHMNQDDKFFQVELFDTQNNMQMIGLEVANFKYKLGEKYKIVPDPRQERNYLLIGGKVNGVFVQQVLQFDSRLQIVEETDISDIPQSFTETQFFGVQSAMYQTESSQIPLLCMAYAKQSSDNGDSQEYINVNQLEILSYDFSSNVWDQIPPIPYQLQDISPQADFQLVIHSNSIYIIGGQQDGQVLKSVLKFDLEQQEWSRCKDMTYPRINFSAVSCGHNGIIVNGGFNGIVAMEHCEVYDHYQDDWHQLPSMKMPRMYHTSLSMEKGEDMNLYVIGGVDFAERLLMTVEIFNLTQLKWQPPVILNEDNIHNQDKAWYNVNLVQLSL